MNRTCLLLAATLFCGTVAIAADEVPSDDGVLFEEMIIRAPAESLDRPLILLRALTNSLPCLGCVDPTPVERPPPAISLLDFLLLPAQPLPQDRAAALATSVRYEGFGPDLGQRR